MRFYVRKSSTKDSLSDVHPATIILRLVVNKRGVIVHGELVNLDGKSLGHFIGWRGLTRALKTWLTTQV